MYKKFIPVLFAASLLPCFAGVSIDGDAFLKSLGKPKKGANQVDYTLSGADYRSFKPETSPTPDGGIFVSVRIDHVRGWLASNDHAVLEVTLGPKGGLASAQSTIAIQGQSISSDVILGGNEAGKEILSPERAVQIGTDLVSNLTAKLLRENIVEAGRVSFPAALRHNYNQLIQAVRVEGVVVPEAIVVEGAEVIPPKPPAMSEAEKPAPASVPATPAPTPPAAPDKTKEAGVKSGADLEIKKY